MDYAAILAKVAEVIGTAVKLAPALADAGHSAEKVAEVAKPFAKLLWDHVINKKVVTAADLVALDAGLTALSARIQADLPPAQPDDI